MLKGHRVKATFSRKNDFDRYSLMRTDGLL